MDNETSTESAGEFNLYEAADELIAESEVNSDSGKGTQAEEQLETDSENTEGDNALTSEDILNQMAKDSDKGIDPEILAKLNSLGMIHKGMPVEIKDEKHLKELIQQGFDYTQKTQSHAETLKEFQGKEVQLQERETQVAQKEQEITREVTENNLITELLTDWKENDPDAFAFVQQAWIARLRHHEQQAPYIKQFEGMVGGLKKEIESLKGQKQSEELGKIRQGFESELKETQEKYAVYLSKLGVKPDWDNKVVEKWKADASGTMTMAQALHAEYGEDIMKAYKSQVKNLETKNKVNSNLLGRTGVRGGMGKAEVKGEIKNGNLSSFLREASANM